MLAGIPTSGKQVHCGADFFARGFCLVPFHEKSMSLSYWSFRTRCPCLQDKREDGRKGWILTGSFAGSVLCISLGNLEQSLRKTVLVLGGPRPRFHFGLGRKVCRVRIVRPPIPGQEEAEIRPLQKHPRFLSGRPASLKREDSRGGFAETPEKSAFLLPFSLLLSEFWAPVSPL